MSKKVVGTWYWIFLGSLIALLVGLCVFSEGGRKAAGEFLSPEKLIVLAVMIPIIIIPIFVGLWWYDKKHPDPTPRCPTCGQELPEDQKSIASPEKS